MFKIIIKKKNNFRLPYQIQHLIDGCARQQQGSHPCCHQPYLPLEFIPTLKPTQSNTLFAQSVNMLCTSSVKLTWKNVSSDHNGVFFLK